MLILLMVVWGLSDSVYFTLPVFGGAINTPPIPMLSPQLGRPNHFGLSLSLLTTTRKLGRRRENALVIYVATA